MKTLIFLMLLPLYSFANFPDFRGTDVGRGGDSIALDFQSTARYDLAFIRQNPNIFNGKVDINQLEKVIAAAKVEVQDQVFLGEVEKIAVNYSNPDRIVVGSKRWLQIPLNDPRKLTLVLHEYFGLMGLDDTSYELTELFLRAVNAHKSTTPLYRCVLIKDPKRMPELSDAVRVGGADGNPIGHLGAEKIRVQIYAGDNGHGTDFLVTISEGAKQIGMLELPRLAEFPRVIDSYALDRSETYWQVHCAQ